MGLSGPASAEDIAETATAIAETLVPVEAPQSANATEFHTVIVENEQVSVRLQRTDLDGTLIEATSIFTHLKDVVSVEGAVLSIERAQDGALMTLDMADGKVRANGVLLGALPDWQPREVADAWLSPNAIAVLSGCEVKEDETGNLTFTLDDRLRPQYDLDLWVNGERISTIGLEPRTIGPVLLIPLKPIIEALGHDLEYDEATGLITVTRIQDSAIMELNIATGLVSVNGVPRGVTPNMSYADARTLLLPFSAIETLTGTHIKLEPGTARIDVNLDDRLDGAALPGERVVDEAAVTPFTPEQLNFQISDRGSSKVEFHSRLRGYNSTLRYETAGAPIQGGSLEPSWISLDVQSLEGWRGSLGDTTTQFRELAGIDQNRIRGISFRKRQLSGTILAIAAGVPVTGAERVGENSSVPTFGGFAAGARLIDLDKNQEIGLSASQSEDGNSSRIVIGGQKEIDLTGAEKGLTSAFIAGEVGVFNDASGTAFDVRGRAEGRYDLTKQSSMQATLSYDGGHFQQGNAPAVDVAGLEGVYNDQVSARTVGSLSADWRAIEDWSGLTNIAGGVRTSFTMTDTSDSASVSASANARHIESGMDISLDIATSSGTSNGKPASTQAVNVRAFRRFDWGNVQAGYTQITTDDVVDQRLIANVTVNPIRKALGDGATATFGPAFSAVWTPDTSYARMGASAAIDSGQKFGDRLSLRAQFSALQSIDPENSQTDIYSSFSARYDITNKIVLDTSYYNDLRGNSDFRIGLRGSVTFNEPRKHTRPNEGTGVLKGRVFFDKNRDGIRQADEPGLPGVRVQVRSTRLSLRVDGEGLYTIQNMKTGLYSLMIDRRSLPLGMLVPDEMEPKVTIGDGRVTTMDIPVIASGQIRGAVYVDTNGNGTLDNGEERLVGAYLTLSRTDAAEGEEPAEARAAAFGQYSFENLAPGEYELTAKMGFRTSTATVTLTEDDLFAVAPIALPPGDEDTPMEAEPSDETVDPMFTA